MNKPKTTKRKKGELVPKNDKTTQVMNLGWSDDQIKLIMRTVAKDATVDELKMFLYQANKVGLDPLAKQIFFTKYQTKSGPQVAIITGIDGFRALAGKSGDYAGQDDVIYDGGVVHKDEPKEPKTAKVTVYRIIKSERVGFSATARMSEYKPSGVKAFMWTKMPYHMLGKVAESLALRKAFPNDLSGLYTIEEMDQADASIASIGQPAETDKPAVDVVKGEIIEGKDAPKPKEYDCAGDKCKNKVEQSVALASQKIKQYKGKVYCHDCQDKIIKGNK